MAKSRVCSIPDCGKPAICRGWCRNHYALWRRNGTPEKTVTTAAEQLQFLEEVVLPYQNDECLMWPFTKESFGYGRIWRNALNKSEYVHRIVCEAVHGPAPDIQPEVAHSCGNGHLGCVNPDHLRWASRKENAADKVRHGRSSRGTRNLYAKLTEQDVREIRSCAKHVSGVALARRYNVSKQTISAIVTGAIWAWLE